MSENVMLTGRCNRRRHVLYRVLGGDTGVLYRVVDSGDGLVIESPRYCATRERGGWTPVRRPLERGRATRYGCGCGWTALVADEDVLRDTRNGVRERVEACYALT